MKKLIFVMMAFLGAISIGMSSCNYCKGGDEQTDTTVVNGPIVVENTVSTDREAMYLRYGSDYKWYESQVLLKDYLDTDSAMEITNVTNVFQVIDEPVDSNNVDVNNIDAHVVIFSHDIATGDSISVIKGMWLEDMPLNEDEIKVTFQEAYYKMMQTDCPKPHSRHCVLRKQIGPVLANPQYIFGNWESQVYVDAITGNVSTENPAFPTKK